MEFHMINITYAALHMRAQTEKNDIFMQRRLYIDEEHTALDIFRFAVFFNRWCQREISPKDLTNVSARGAKNFISLCRGGSVCIVHTFHPLVPLYNLERFYFIFVKQKLQKKYFRVVHSSVPPIPPYRYRYQADDSYQYRYWYCSNLQPIPILVSVWDRNRYQVYLHVICLVLVPYQYRYQYRYRYRFGCLSSIGMKHQPGIGIGMNVRSGIGISIGGTLPSLMTRVPEPLSEASIS